MSTQQKTAAIFIDAENLYFIQKALGWEIDFERLYNFVATKYNIYNAFYYTVTDPTNDAFEEKNQFLASLSLIGYTVRKKEVKVIRVGDKYKKKGNLDIEMVIDMFNTKELYERALLFSGDSDFERAIELLRSHGKESVVISTKGFVSRELINAADKFIDLQLLKSEIEKLPEDKGLRHTTVPGVLDLHGKPRKRMLAPRTRITPRKENTPPQSGNSV